jgi:Phospholipase_D-nuclease N-terminal/Short C-terminal domain
MVEAASSYPLLNVFWSMVVFFCWMIWIWLLITILTDFYRSDASGWAKAGWTVFVILLPFLGALIYLIVHGGAMSKRRREYVQRSQTEFDDHVRDVTVSSNGHPAEEIGRAKELLDSGAVTQAEYEALKHKALAR